MQDTVNEEVRNEILDIKGIEKAERDFEKIDGNWYGTLGFEFRSDEPVDMVDLFRKERPEDTIYYKSGKKISDKKYKFFFVVKSEDTRLEEKEVGSFADFAAEVRNKAQRLEDIPAVDDGYVFENEEDSLEDFLVSAQESLVEPDTPIPLHYLTPDSVSENEHGEKTADGVAINSDIYVRKQNGRIYQLKPKN